MTHISRNGKPRNDEDLELEVVAEVRREYERNHPTTLLGRFSPAYVGAREEYVTQVVLDRVRRDGVGC